MKNLSVLTSKKIRWAILSSLTLILTLIFLTNVITNFYFKERSADSTSKMSVKTANSIYKTGDWALLVSYLTTLEYSGFNNIELKYKNQTVLGPINPTLSLYPICKTSRESDIEINICTDFIDIQNVFFVGLSTLTITLLLLIIWKKVQKTILKAVSNISEAILSINRNDPQTVYAHHAVTEYPEITHIKNLLSNAVSEKEKAQYFKISKQLAHDLRSPINTLKILHKEIQKKNENEDIELTLLASTIERLNTITNDFLNNKPKVNDCPNLLHCIIEVCLQVFGHLDTKNTLKIIGTETLFSNQPLIQFDLLSRVFQNILINSKEAQSDSRKLLVCIKAVQVNNKAINISIEDNGTGFPNKIIDDLNKGIYQTTKANGHGLGLEFVINTLNSSGGSFKITNIDNNYGCKIEITIPSQPTYETSTKPLLLSANQLSIKTLNQFLGDNYSPKNIIEDNSILSSEFKIKNLNDQPVSLFTILGFSLEEAAT